MLTPRLCAVFMLVFLALGAGMGARAIVTAIPDVSWAGAHDWLNGKKILTFEKKFDEHTAHYEPSVNLWGTMGYALFREGKKGVLIGQDGWLYTSEEFDFPKDFDHEIQKKVEFIAAVRDELKAKNISLFVVPIPAKSRVYAEHTGKYPYPTYWAGQYAGFLTALAQKNIPHADILAAFQNKETSLYLKTDTHWTPEGARKAAHSISASIASAYPYLSYEHQEFKVAMTGAIEHRGDLLRYVSVKPFEEKFGIMPDQLNKYSITAPETDDLFGGAALPVTLVGTSYSANKNWPFADFLKESLQTDLLNAADEGLGPFEVMQKYLNSTAYKDTPPQLVIWEIPERYLPVHYDLTLENVK